MNDCSRDSTRADAGQPHSTLPVISAAGIGSAAVRGVSLSRYAGTHRRASPSARDSPGAVADVSKRLTEGPGDDIPARLRSRDVARLGPVCCVLRNTRETDGYASMSPRSREKTRPDPGAFLRPFHPGRYRGSRWTAMARAGFPATLRTLCSVRAGFQ